MPGADECNLDQPINRTPLARVQMSMAERQSNGSRAAQDAEDEDRCKNEIEGQHRCLRLNWTHFAATGRSVDKVSDAAASNRRTLSCEAAAGRKTR
jgi:hypothetical protein